MPPSTTDRKISSTTIDMITKQLGKKADEPWVRDVLTLHKEDISETKEIALATKHKLENRVCQKEKTIDDMMKAINGFKNVKLAGVISVIVIVLGWASQFFALQDKVDDTAESMDKVEKSVEVIKKSSDSNAVMFKEYIAKETEEKQIEEREDAIQQKKEKKQHEELLKAIKKRR